LNPILTPPQTSPAPSPITSIAIESLDASSITSDPSSYESIFVPIQLQQLTLILCN